MIKIPGGDVMENPEIWCIDPKKIKEDLWELANPKKESTVSVDPRVIIDEVHRALRWKLSHREVREIIGIIEDDLLEIWRIFETCPEEYTEECSQMISKIFENILRVPPLRRIFNRVISELRTNFENLHGGHNLYFVIDWSRYSYKRIQRKDTLLINTMALGVSFELKKELHFVEPINKVLKKKKTKVKAVISKRKQWIDNQIPTLIISWECIKKVTSDTARDDIIEDLLRQIPILGKYVQLGILTRDLFKDVANCIKNYGIVIE